MRRITSPTPLASTLLASALLAVASGCTTDSTSHASEAPEGDSAAETDTATTDADGAMSDPQTQPSQDSEAQPSGGGDAAGLYALEVQSLDGEPVDLSEYAGQVTLVVNVASQCGYTGQYAGLQELYSELADEGFAVLAFPSNEFGGQEPGSPEEIREFCTSRYSVEFPMFAKCEVKPGGGQSPVYSYLAEQTGETPSWNFCKYLVGKDGQAIAFYKSSVGPDASELREAIQTAMN